MFKYTKSAISETFDFAKKLIYVFQIVVQFLYIGFVGYRLIYSVGNLIGNIILLVISIFYLIFQFVTTNEFHTKRMVTVKEKVKWIVKISKYIVNIYIIVIAVLPLINNHTSNDNASMLVTILMIIGLIVSIVFDVIVILIDQQFELIELAFKHDLYIFRKSHPIQTQAIKFALKLDLNEMVQELPKRDADKVLNINKKQEEKGIRKRDFFRRKKK